MQSQAFHSGLIDRLFLRLACLYGSKFNDMWREMDPEEVKKCWSYELRIFSVEQVGIAVSNLRNKPFPPTLPEFIALCESARAQKPRGQDVPAIAAPVSVGLDEANAEAIKARWLAMSAKVGNGPPNRQWAHKIMDRVAHGEILPHAVAKMAQDALAQEPMEVL